MKGLLSYEFNKKVFSCSATEDLAQEIKVQYFDHVELVDKPKASDHV
jgi:hypothetical protein